MNRSFVGCAGFVGFVWVGASGSPIVRGPMLDAHNCYPEDGKWNDRLARAVATKQAQIGIEQDLVWTSRPMSPSIIDSCCSC